MKITRTSPRLLAILLMALAACTQDDAPLAPADDAIRIRTTLTPFATPDATAPGTRATIDPNLGTGTFDLGDEISLYVRTSSGNVLSESTATFQADGWNYPLTWSQLEESATNNPIEFRSFFPPQTMDANEQFTFTVQTDQSSDAAYRASHLLEAQTRLTARGEVNLKFRHCMSQIKIVLLPGPGITAEELNAATVDIRNLPTQIKLWYNGGVVGSAFGTAATITPWQSPTEANTFYALIIPQEVASKKLPLTLHLGPRSIPHEVPLGDDYIFYRGDQRILNLTLGYATSRSGATISVQSSQLIGEGAAEETTEE